MRGDLVMVFKNKQGERLIDEAIAIGIKGYIRHYPACTKDDLIAYVNPVLFNELDMKIDGDHEIPVDSNIAVPYPGVWVCLKESEDV
jgi:hypothetical protein